MRARLKPRLIRLWMIVSALAVLALTLFLFACYHFMWLPSLFPGWSVRINLGIIGLGLIGGSLLLLAFAYELWRASGWLASRNNRRYGLVRFLLLVPVILALLSIPIGRRFQLSAAHRADPLLAAIEAYERTHDGPPTSLDELVPELIDEIPRPKLLQASMNRFVYNGKPPSTQVSLSFALAFGFHHALAGNIAVVYCPESAVDETADEKSITLELRLPLWDRPDLFHEYRVKIIRRLDESWVLARSE